MDASKFRLQLSWLLIGSILTSLCDAVEGPMSIKESAGAFSSAAVIGDSLSQQTISHTSAVRLSRLDVADEDIAPKVKESSPAAGAVDVARNAPVSMRFVDSMEPSTISEQSIVLSGPQGAVPGIVELKERNTLITFTPNSELLPGTHYTLFVDGAVDEQGKSIPFTAIEFTTKASELASSNEKNTHRTNDTSPTPSVDALRVGTSATQTRPGCASDSSASNYCRADGVVSEGYWFPGKSNLGGHWRINGKYPLVPDRRLIANRTFPANATGIYGRVLRVDDRPVQNAKVSIGKNSTTTDSKGVFVLTGVPSNHQVIEIDGASAGSGDVVFGNAFVGVDIREGTVTAMPSIVYLPRIHPQDRIHIPAPTTTETIISHPEIPGLEIRIPAGTVLKDAHGHVLTDVAIVPMPADRFTVPLPGNFPMAFSFQPEGATVQALQPSAAKGIRISYPIDQKLSGASHYSFWLYDAVGAGWKVYSSGKLSEDGSHLIAEGEMGESSPIPTGYTVGGPYPPSTSPPPDSCNDECDINPPNEQKGSGGGGCDPCGNGADTSGDPVDNSSGLFLFHRTDLAVEDVLPIRVARIYRSVDLMRHSLGAGTSFNFSMYLFDPSTPDNLSPPEIDLILSDGEKIPFLLSSGNLDNGGPGLWLASTAPGRFDGAILINREFVSPCGICILLKDGTTYVFPTQGDPSNPSWLQAVIDRFGNTLTLSYSGNLLTQISSPSGRFVSFAYNASNTVQEISDNSGRSVSYTYNGAGSLDTVTFADNTTEHFTYDGNGNMLTAVDRRGNTIFTNQYDSNQRVSQQTLPDTSTYTWIYTLSSGGEVQATDVTDPYMAVKHVTFDAAGYPLSITRAYGTSLAQLTTFVRGDDEKPISVTDALGRTTTSTYDALGNLTNVTYLAGTSDAVTYSYTYTPDFNQLASVTDPLGNTAAFGYDVHGCLTSATDGLGNSTSFTCNSAGQRTSATDALGRTTTFTFAGYDLQTMTDSINRKITLTTDSLGRKTGITAALGVSLNLQFDTNNKIFSTTDSANQTTSFEHDGNGNLSSVTDPNHGTTQWVFDPQNRVSTRTDSLNQSMSWTYDGLGNVLTHHDQVNQLTQWAYDLLARPSSVAFSDSTVTPTFDLGNRLIQLQDSSSGMITWTYDGMNRLKQEQTSQGSVNYIYDAAGRRSQMTAANQSPVTYTYDNAYRLTKISQASEIVKIAYDNSGRRTSLTLPNGVAVAYAYDDARQLTGLTYSSAVGALIGELTYTYDGIGRIASKAGGFQADLLPTTTTANGIFDLNNELTSFNGVSFAYKSDGSLTSDGSYSYGWDARHRLINITRSGNTVASFTYDATGRRSSKTIAGVTTSFLYDGKNAVQEAQGSTITTLLTGLNVDERFARDESAGRRYFLTDQLGSTIALTDASGTVQQTYGYEPFGETSATGLSNNPYQYTGRENDGTGLYYFRARYYSPTMKRFMSEDPMGLAAGLNSYAYVGGNPLNYVDPLGLEQGPAYKAIYLDDGGVPQYSNNGYHYYDIWVPLCTGCTQIEAFNAMRNFSAPGAPPAIDGSRDLVLTGNNPINQTVDPCTLTITNTTLPGHTFGGSVTISIVEQDGVMGARIVGTGDGPNPIINQLTGPIVFNLLGAEAAESLQ